MSEIRIIFMAFSWMKKLVVTVHLVAHFCISLRVLVYCTYHCYNYDSRAALFWSSDSVFTVRLLIIVMLKQ